MKKAKLEMINAFFKLAKVNPIPKIKVKHVTDLANYNRCTFYQYFEDIYDLLDQAENMLIEQIKNKVEQAYSSNVSYEDILILAASSFQEFGEILSILMGPGGSPSFHNKYMNMLRPVVRSIMKKKNLYYNDFLAEYALGAFLSTVSYWYYHQENMSAEELASMIYDLTTEGIFPGKRE